MKARNPKTPSEGATPGSRARPGAGTEGPEGGWHRPKGQKYLTMAHNLFNLLDVGFVPEDGDIVHIIIDPTLRSIGTYVNGKFYDTWFEETRAKHIYLVAKKLGIPVVWRGEP